MPQNIAAPFTGLGDIDIDAVLAGLRDAHPGVVLWYGEYTGALWAYAGDRLVEADDAEGLGRGIAAASPPVRTTVPRSVAAGATGRPARPVAPVRRAASRGRRSPWWRRLAARLHGARLVAA
ncbi:hypothetical protein [Actinomadura parmotrematis]|uniref:Uncharacterized protein n=1 Tax=Actinomadura parmotrematis TaxID=2864039 RepID=A0ABS7FR92_9ACTN|nr:hypothetical protein [Actinomadura parmotrematis]MBW8482881.1 hypothetical protein [Actinomadura parmotrematis]